MVVANPVPLRFWERAMLWRTSGVHGNGLYRLGEGFRPAKQPPQPNNLDHPALVAARGRPDVEAFLFWSRMPIVIKRDGQLFLADQRFNSELTRGQFLVPLTSSP